jgi:3'-5' exoribonuclease
MLGGATNESLNGNGARRTRRFLAEMRPGDRADEIFVINNVQLGKKRNGEPFLKMLVCDRSARIASKWWDRGPAMLEKLPDPGVVRVRATMEDFQGAPQLVIEQIFLIGDPARIDFTELLPATTKNVEAMFAELAEILRAMRSPTLHALAEAYLADEALMSAFRRAPAAMMFHHAYLGGLLEHTLAAMKLGDALCAFYPRLNRDLVVFGVFVHDLAKTWELRYETCFDYTDAGRLIGHIVKSAMWVEEKARVAQHHLGRAVPQEVIDLLQHIILSHHGELESGFGSAKSPATPEAWAVHMIENLDAKLTMALMACRGEEGGRWTEHLKSLGGKLFRPDIVARADADARASEVGNTGDEGVDSQGRASGGPPGAGPMSSNPLFGA